MIPQNSIENEEVSTPGFRAENDEHIITEVLNSIEIPNVHNYNEGKKRSEKKEILSEGEEDHGSNMLQRISEVNSGNNRVLIDESLQNSNSSLSKYSKEVDINKEKSTDYRVIGSSDSYLEENGSEFPYSKPVPLYSSEFKMENDS